MDNLSLHERAGQVIEVVLDLEPAQQYQEINRLCNQDDKLKAEVLSLVKFARQDSGLLDKPFFKADSILEAKPDLDGSGSLDIPGFELIQLLGQGSSSIVYLAKQLDPVREVAIKVLRPTSCSDQAIKRIKAEAHLLARIEHPDIARIYQVGMIQSPLYVQPFMVMELAKGLPLHHLNFKHHLNLNQRVDLINRICIAIHYAHEEGIIHRDLKPSNILVHFDSAYQNLELTIIDFGIAKLIHGEQIPIDIQTISPELLGTLRYMSPERKTGQSSGDSVTSDMYSIGVLAKEFILNDDPDESNTPNGSICPEESIPDSIKNVFNKMTEESPKDRYSSLMIAATKLRLALETNKLNASKSSRIKSYSRLMHKPVIIAVATIATGTMLSNSYLQFDKGKQSTLPNRQPLDLMLSAIGSQEFGDDQSLESKIAILDTRIRLIAENARDGHQSESLRIVDLIETESFDLNNYPLIQQQSYLTSKAFALGKSGFTEQSIDSYTRAKELASLERQPLANVAKMWGHIANGLRENGEHEIARQMYDELISHQDFSTLSWSLQSNTLAFSAGLYWLDHDYVKAESMFRTLVEIAPSDLTQEEELVLAEKISSLGVVLTSLGRLDEAEAQLKRAISIAVKYHISSHRVVCRYARNLGITYYFQGDFKNAISSLLFVRSIWGAMPEGWKKELAGVDFFLGSSYLIAGNYDLAIHHLQLSKLSTGRDNKPWPATIDGRVDNAIGAYLYETGNHAEGIAIMSSSLDLMKQSFPQNSVWLQIANQRFENYCMPN